MTNEEIREQEGEDFKLIDDYYSTRQVKVAIAARAGKAAEAFKKLQIDVDELGQKVEALATDLSFKGSVADQENLPADAAVGDTYITEDDGILYVWVGDKWVALNEDSGIPTDATFWGASYDAENNRVYDDITLPNSSTRSGKIKSSVSDGSYFGFSGAALPMIAGHTFAEIYARSDGGWVITGGNGSDRGIYIGGMTANDSLRIYKQKITKLDDPEEDTGAANKHYVDTAVASAGAATLTNEQFNSIFNTNLEEA